MLTFDDFPEMQRQYENYKKKYHEEQGKTKAALSLLKKYYRVNTIDEAKVLHKKMMKKLQDMMGEDSTEYTAFKKEFNELFEDA